MLLSQTADTLGRLVLQIDGLTQDENNQLVCVVVDKAPVLSSIASIKTPIIVAWVWKPAPSVVW